MDETSATANHEERLSRGGTTVQAAETSASAEESRARLVEAFKGRPVTLLSKEYPPYVYGGAGVHVDELSRALRRYVAVEVRAFGELQLSEDGLHARGYTPWAKVADGTPKELRPVLECLSQNLLMAKDCPGPIVHAHTWYADFAGFLAKKLWGSKLVVTIHSLEPLRPWKREQLGRAYDASSWMEKTAIENADAVIAVSEGTKKDVLRHFDVAAEKVHVIHNGIDLTVYRKTAANDALIKHGVDPSRPYVLFVGRITRQKGIIHLVEAARHLDRAIQVVLCAGQPDTREIGDEMRKRISVLRGERDGVIWVEQMLPKAEVIQLYSHAAVFCCPSVYEPFGIINLEAMATGTPVVASAVGGIPEVVVPNETGLLINPQLKPNTFEPEEPKAFARALANAIEEVALDPVKRERMGANGRRRAEEHFSWDAIARRTVALYASILEDEATATTH